ncbi:hypothetical protein [Lysinibacillus piscis]|uniref:Uncharacterized protein n=1 Tax=Lysinibacillus piscis TaxID=2518931 RepID=A0ABQ5NLX8_9BACI|nr:hypothetical protein [Lysinibacillus sp. KH24]GLC89312.1 hypothetical protein LYSBPC_24390 [Lysinibacillus sp. KH24]
MFIKFDEFELLELFEKEPMVIGDAAAGMFIYSKKDDLGFTLVLTVSIYEKQCNLSLVYPNFETSIFEFELKNIDRIIGEDQKLKILRHNSEKSIEVIFKPHFALKKLVL